jgi:hypothetical protein
VTSSAPAGPPRPTTGTTALHLPAPKEVRDLLAELLGREVSLLPAGALTPCPINPATAGVYVDPVLRVVAGLVLDLPLSARVGAAVGLVPPLAALEAVERGHLGAPLRAGVQHLLEGAASLFGVAGDAAPRVRLHATHHTGDPVPSPTIVQALARPRHRDLVVQVAGYGSGRLAVTCG